MLHLSISAKELWQEQQELFITIPATEVDMEHSLFSLSKWESKYKKPFLTNNKKFAKTASEMADYFSMMCVDKNVDPIVFRYLADEEFDILSEYLQDSNTATWINTPTSPNAVHREETTAEIIYYMMVEYNIPFETQYWHINRLLTLIQVIQIKNSGEQSSPPTADYLQERNRLNEQRKALYQTNG